MPRTAFKLALILGTAFSSTAATADEVTVFALQTGNYTVGGSGFAAGGLARFQIISGDFDPENLGLNALLGFDTAGAIPADATVNAVRFEYQIDTVAPGSSPVLLESLLGPFSFGGATQAAQSHTPQGTLPAVLGPGSVPLTVATAVDDLLDPAGRFTLRLTAPEPSQSFLQFSGSGDSFSTTRNPRRPRLVIDFTPADPTPVGDLNLDGFVSQSDLDLVLLNFGRGSLPPEWLDADGFDGQVSQNELDRVLLHFGSGRPPDLAAIPEPAGAALGVGLGLLLIPRRTPRTP